MHKQLFSACHLGAYDAIKSIIDQDATLVNSLNHIGTTPLMAIMRKNTLPNNWQQIVQFLLDSGADIDIMDNAKNTVLSYLCENNHSDVAQFLVQFVGNKICIRIHDMKICCNKNNIHLASFLLKYYDPNNQDQDGNTLLMYSCINNYKNMVELLLNNNVNLESENTNCNNRTALLLAYHHNNMELVQLLLNNGANINANSTRYGTLLQYACENNKFDDVKFFVQHGAHVNDCNIGSKSSALTNACRNNNIEMIAFLLDNGAVITTELITVISYNSDSSAHWGIPIAKLLLKESAKHKSANINYIGEHEQTALFEAIYRDNIVMINFLLDNGANTDGAFIRAVCHRNPDIIKLLYQRNVNIEQTTKNGSTGLMISEDPNTIKLLCELGANINATNINGHSVLSNTCIHAHVTNNTEILEYLLSMGIDVNKFFNNKLNKTETKVENDHPIYYGCDICYAYDLKLYNVNIRNLILNKYMENTHDFCDEWLNLYFNN